MAKKLKFSLPLSNSICWLISDLKITNLSRYQCSYLKNTNLFFNFSLFMAFLHFSFVRTVVQISLWYFFLTNMCANTFFGKIQNLNGSVVQLGTKISQTKVAEAYNILHSETFYSLLCFSPTIFWINCSKWFSLGLTLCHIYKKHNTYNLFRMLFCGSHNIVGSRVLKSFPDWIQWWSCLEQTFHCHWKWNTPQSNTSLI